MIRPARTTTGTSSRSTRRCSAASSTGWTRWPASAHFRCSGDFGAISTVDAMTTISRRTLNDSITRFWSFAAPAYDQRCLQRYVYQPAQDEVLAALGAHRSRRVADVACGTGILAARIADELRPEEVYGVDMSDGMLAKARQRSPSVFW